MIPTVPTSSFDLSPLFAEIIQKAAGFWPYTVTYAKGFVSLIVILSIPLSLFFLIVIVYCVEQLKVINKRWEEKHDLHVEPAIEEVKGAGDRNLSTRWAKVTALMGSENVNDWKQAILESDMMLDAILNGLGYQGESIGEKLKRVQPGEMKNVQDAWDAHKVRNSIAHDGAFALTHHEANQAIQQYRRVFEEFYYI